MSKKPAAIVAGVVAVAAIAFIAFGAQMEAQSTADLNQLYASLGRPECLTDADLETHVGYITSNSSLSPAEARASIEKSMRDHVPNEWWTRFALHPEEEPSSTAPPTKPCNQTAAAIP